MQPYIDSFRLRGYIYRDMCKSGKYRITLDSGRSIVVCKNVVDEVKKMLDGNNSAPIGARYLVWVHDKDGNLETMFDAKDIDLIESV